MIVMQAHVKLANVLVSALNLADSVNCIIMFRTSLTCYDGQLDGDETAIDCGGSCAGCGLNSNCLRRDDCGEGTCQACKCAVSALNPADSFNCIVIFRTSSYMP